MPRVRNPGSVEPTVWSRVGARMTGSMTGPWQGCVVTQARQEAVVRQSVVAPMLVCDSCW